MSSTMKGKTLNEYWALAYDGHDSIELFEMSGRASNVYTAARHFATQDEAEKYLFKMAENKEENRTFFSMLEGESFSVCQLQVVKIRQEVVF